MVGLKGFIKVLFFLRKREFLFSFDDFEGMRIKFLYCIIILVKSGEEIWRVRKFRLIFRRLNCSLIGKFVYLWIKRRVSYVFVFDFHNLSIVKVVSALKYFSLLSLRSIYFVKNILRHFIYSYLNFISL